MRELYLFIDIYSIYNIAYYEDLLTMREIWKSFYGKNLHSEAFVTLFESIKDGMASIKNLPAMVK